MTKKETITAIIEKVALAEEDMIAYACDLEDANCAKTADELREIIGAMEEWKYNAVKRYLRK